MSIGFVGDTATVSLPITPRQLVSLVNGPRADLVDQAVYWYDTKLLTFTELYSILYHSREMSIHDQEDVAPTLVDIRIPFHTD